MIVDLRYAVKPAHEELGYKELIFIPQSLPTN